MEEFCLVKLFLVYVGCAHINVASTFSDFDSIVKLPSCPSVRPGAADGSRTHEKGLVSASETPVNTCLPIQPHFTFQGPPNLEKNMLVPFTTIRFLSISPWFFINHFPYLSQYYYKDSWILHLHCEVYYQYQIILVFLANKFCFEWHILFPLASFFSFFPFGLYCCCPFIFPLHRGAAALSSADSGLEFLNQVGRSLPQPPLIFSVSA